MPLLLNISDDSSPTRNILCGSIYCLDMRCTVLIQGNIQISLFIQEGFLIMESFVEVQATMPKSSKVICATICPTKISVKTEKTYKAKKMTEILNIIVALLNSGGGKLVLSYERSPPPTHIMDCVRMIEQKLEMLIGCAKMVSKIRKSSYPNRIDFLVMASDGLITLNYNLYLPTKAQVLAVPSTDPPEELKNVIDGQNSLACKELSSCKEDFFKGQYVGFEEDVDVQFKSLKAGATKCVTLADRVVNKSNKLASYVSAFANHKGGHVYYGINDNGIVEGEEVSNKDEIIKKVNNAINKLIWPDHCCKPKRGQEWDIFFVPVKNNEGEEIPTIFVIVIAVACCSGGVFVNVPESYHIVHGNVKPMSLKVWKTKLSASAISSATEDNQPLATSDRVGKQTPACPVQVPTVPTHLAPQTNSKDESCSDVSKQFDAPSVYLNACCLALQQRSTLQPSQGPSHIWSSVKNRDSFISLTTMLVKFRNNDNMTDFHRLSNWFKENRPKSNACVVAVKAEKIAVAYKNHQFQKADHLLEKLDELVQKFVKDASMLESRVLYLKSRVKRAKGNFEQSYEIATAGLQKVQLIQPGFISVWSYLNAAFLANVLSNRERDDNKCEALRKEERMFLEWAQRDALTLKHVPAEMIDLEQKLHIYQAMSFLGCPLTGEASNGPHHVTQPEDLKNASLHLDEVYKLGELTHFRMIQCLFVKSDLLLQCSASSSHPDRDHKSSCHCVEEALGLAREHHFEEMIEYSEKRLEAFVRDSSNDNDSEWLKELGVDCLTELEN